MEPFTLNEHDVGKITKSWLIFWYLVSVKFLFLVEASSTAMISDQKNSLSAPYVHKHNG